MSIHSTGLGADEASVARSAKLRAADFIKYATITDWELISGMRRTATYEALGCGNLRAIKLDNRTLIDEDPSPRDSKATRQALTVAFVKPVRGSC